MRRTPHNAGTRFFTHMEELKHLSGNRGGIHPGRGRRGSCHHPDLVDQTYYTVLESVARCLMRPDAIEVLDMGMKDTIQLLLLKDEQVIETSRRTLPRKRSQTALARGV